MSLQPSVPPTDYRWVTHAIATGALFETANATIVTSGKVDLKQGAVSAISDAIATPLADWLSTYISDPAMRAYLRPYLVGPLASGFLYVLLAKCATGVDSRGWLVPFLTQLGAAEASTALMRNSPLGKVGSARSSS
jgi:hypothetical protein